jgi:transcriptional regulator GlxA family with amidase domain
VRFIQSTHQWAFDCVAGNLRHSPSSSSRATWRVRKVVTYIESNLSETIPVAALARTAGVSYSCFHRTFRACFGFTPHVYVTLKRVEFAQTLMLTTNEPLSQISLACGMTDQSHFTRIFRGLTGKTPGQWRTWRRNNFDQFNQTITTGRTSAASQEVTAVCADAANNGQPVA